MKKEYSCLKYHFITHFFKKIPILIVLYVFSFSCQFPPNPFNQWQLQQNETLEYGMKLQQYGITWYFDKEYEYGQFANGDYYVIGPVTIVSIEPGSSSHASRVMNGSQLNPIPKMYNRMIQQGYEDFGGANDTYDAALNVGLNVSTKNPLVLSSGSSLVTSISIPTLGARPQLSDAAVLTVLDSAPKEGSFRPPYSGSNKAVKFNISDINFSILPSLSQSGIAHKLNTSDVNTICATLKRCWIDHFVNQADEGQYLSPKNNMPNYGREYCMLIGQASILACMSDAELTANFGITRKDVLIGLIQIGIDNYEVLKNGGCWPNNGGLNQGRKWTIMFAGALLGGASASSGDAYDMLHIKDFSFTVMDLLGGVNSITSPFAEDQTIFYVSMYDYNACHVSYWGDESHTPYIGPDIRADASVAYEMTDLGLPEWGICRMTNPETTNKHWTATYRTCCTGNAYAGIALVARILESSVSTMTLWGNDAFFDYIDRYMAIGIKSDWERSWSNFTGDMWDKYRASYGVGYIGQVYINGTTVITNCINKTTGYDGVTGVKVSGSTDISSGFAINSSVFSSITGFIGTSSIAIDSNHYRIYGDCVAYGIVK